MTPGWRRSTNSEIKKAVKIHDVQTITWPLAHELGVKIAWGTDLISSKATPERSKFILKLQSFLTNVEILKLITHDNAQLLQLSGKLSPYPEELGVIKEGALADLLLVKGNPLKDLSLIAHPKKNLALIMKDGKIYKNTLTHK